MVELIDFDEFVTYLDELRAARLRGQAGAVNVTV
jgi:hypothetical protein